MYTTVYIHVVGRPGDRGRSFERLTGGVAEFVGDAAPFEALFYEDGYRTGADRSGDFGFAVKSPDAVELARRASDERGGTYMVLYHKTPWGQEVFEEMRRMPKGVTDGVAAWALSLLIGPHSIAPTADCGPADFRSEFSVCVGGDGYPSDPRALAALLWDAGPVRRLREFLANEYDLETEVAVEACA